MSKLVSICTNFVGVVVALIAILVGVIAYTTIPRQLGLWKYMADQNPRLIGMGPAFLSPEEWNYTFERLYSNDLQGQYALVTGASSGIGFAITETLAGRLGVHVTMACRNPAKCLKKKKEILAKHPSALLSTMTMDTSSLKSVNNFANEYLATNKPLDILYLNAGSNDFPDPETQCIALTKEDNLEINFQVNYLGHHLLYRKLEGLLLTVNNEESHKNNNTSIPARVIQTSSLSSFDSYSFRVPTTLEQLNGCLEPAFSAGASLSYGQTKLAQILWVKDLTKRLAADVAKDEDGTTSRRDIIANAFAPGIVATEIFTKFDNCPEHLLQFYDWMARKIGWTSFEGALTGLYLGVEVDELLDKNIRGEYFHPQVTPVTNPLATDRYAEEELQEKFGPFPIR